MRREFKNGDYDKHTGKAVAMTSGAKLEKEAFRATITRWRADIWQNSFHWQSSFNADGTAMRLAKHFLGKADGETGLEAAAALFKAAIVLRKYGMDAEADCAAKRYVSVMFGQKWYGHLEEDAKLLGVGAHLSELKEAVRKIDMKMARGDYANAGIIAERHGLRWHLWELAHADKANAGNAYRLEAILYMGGITDTRPELPIVPAC